MDIKAGQFWKDKKGRTFYVLETGLYGIEARVEVEDEMGVLKLMRVDDFKECELIEVDHIEGFIWNDGEY